MVGYRKKGVLREWEKLKSLAATDGDDDFQLITADQRGLRMLALGNNFAIALNGDAFAGVAKRIDEGGNRERGRELAIFAIDLEFEHRAILASRAVCAGRW